MVTEQQAIDELNELSDFELVELIAKLHLEQYGVEPEWELGRKEAIQWFFVHYKWVDGKWKSKRYILDPRRDFMTVTEFDLDPNRLLH